MPIQDTATELKGDRVGRSLSNHLRFFQPNKDITEVFWGTGRSVENGLSWCLVRMGEAPSRNSSDSRRAHAIFYLLEEAAKCSA
jgi:hypothetical protein